MTHTAQAILSLIKYCGETMVTAGALLAAPLLELWVLVAHLVLPARNVEGYVRDAKGKPLKYRL